LYRLRREIDQIKKGDLNRHFILRAEDQLQSLAHSLEEMNSVLLSKSKELKSRWQELDRYLSQKNIAAEERETINKMKQEIETVLNYFKS
jgi:signal transduction histidine kinase